MLSVGFVKVVKRDCAFRRFFTSFVGTRTHTRPVVSTDLNSLVDRNGRLSDVYLQIRIRDRSFAAVILPQAQPEAETVFPLEAACFRMRMGTRVLRRSDRRAEEVRVTTTNTAATSTIRLARTEAPT